MADKVEQVMEPMVDEFNYYRDTKIFSTGQIQEIVKQRREHEY